jgi:hypothetical protein
MATSLAANGSKTNDHAVYPTWEGWQPWALTVTEQYPRDTAGFRREWISMEWCWGSDRRIADNLHEQARSRYPAIARFVEVADSFSMTEFRHTLRNHRRAKHWDPVALGRRHPLQDPNRQQGGYSLVCLHPELHRLIAPRR